MRSTLCILFLFFAASIASTTEYHVAVTGSDGNDGSALHPFRTISAAARVAQPGDVITVHAGIYREWVRPPRGGESDQKRIVYQAASGEKVEIAGSEVVKGWSNVQGDVWKVVLPDSMFGQFNPYSDEIHGDWFEPLGRVHHTGAVYLNGEWLTEAAKPGDVSSSAGDTPFWSARVDSKNTTIYAQFKDVNPNEQTVEINVRRTVFYPEKTGINYITVRGFILRDGATPWAPPTAEQIGIIGPHWSKGWIIENNIIRHAACSGISLGKYGDQFDNTSANSAEGYVKTIDRALANGWNKETVGHHIVRNNTISDCEQAGIVGSLGAIYSEISNNHIFNIWTRRLFNGAEMAGIKLHGAVDVLIKHNRIHNAGRGLWLDWMAQGTRVSGNLFYNNSTDDILLEVNHGPYIVDNNIFLSECSIRDVSEGGAFVQNLFGGIIDDVPDVSRLTPYLQPHSTLIAGMSRTEGGDDRFYNNIFLCTNPSFKSNEAPPRFAGFGLWVYDTREAPLRTRGNVYYNGARAYGREPDPLVLADDNPKLELIEDGDNVFVQMALGQGIMGLATDVVTTERLGTTKVGGLRYENPDGTPLKFDRNYFGRARNPENPAPGPFGDPVPGITRIRVW